MGLFIHSKALKDCSLDLLVSCLGLLLEMPHAPPSQMWAKYVAQSASTHLVAWAIFSDEQNGLHVFSQKRICAELAVELSLVVQLL